jgi:hypothetical protein
MNPETFNLISTAMSLAIQFMTNFPAIREAASTEDKARLDELYAQFRDASNAVADRLAATPDDPI